MPPPSFKWTRQLQNTRASVTVSEGTLSERRANINDLKDSCLRFVVLRSWLVPIAWRPATRSDIEPSLEIQPKNYGSRLVGRQAALEAWQYMATDPFFASAVLEANPPIGGLSRIGFGASVFIKTSFADAEIGSPRPDLNSRIVAGIHAGRSPLLTRSEVAQANAGEGVDIVVLAGNWRDEIITADARRVVHTLLIFSFTEWLVGFRVRRILCETVDEAARKFVQASVEYRTIAEFPDVARSLHLMTFETATALPASAGNLIFKYDEPTLHLRESDQRLLMLALRGATDSELAAELAITVAAVKARWRSTFAHIAEQSPHLLSYDGEHRYRSKQKRHHVLAYLRTHPEELRPYDWKKSLSAKAANVQ
jgi:hypothetical protein